MFNHNPNWEVMIGLEIHVQLSTVSKIFSEAPVIFGVEPNTQTSWFDLALPGTLPVLNRVAVDHALRLGLSLGAQISKKSFFSRKNYFYPDLPKGYQISQYEVPLLVGGSLTIQLSETDKAYQKTINIIKAHLEEDAGKSLHEESSGITAIDLNRAGTPLLEIVSEPEMSSALEAVAYAKALYKLAVWIGVCNGNMQEGSFRFDANVSIRPFSDKILGTRTEIKNLNSFHFLEDAINYEIQRQIELIESGGKVLQETRLYNQELRKTFSMRSKENDYDYRYFPDPDLPPLIIHQEWIDEVSTSLPELPQSMRDRFIKVYDLSKIDADMVTTSYAHAVYFESVMTALGRKHVKIAVNWIVKELSSYLNSKGIGIDVSIITPLQLSGLIQRIGDNTISNKIGKEVFRIMCESTPGITADQIIKQHALEQISEKNALERTIENVLATNQKLIHQYKKGKKKAFNALVGQTLKATNGKANPNLASELIKIKLKRYIPD